MPSCANAQWVEIGSIYLVKRTLVHVTYKVFDCELAEVVLGITLIRDLNSRELPKL
jgi:hypothetical protein